MQYCDGLTDLAVTFAVGDFCLRFHIANTLVSDPLPGE